MRKILMLVVALCIFFMGCSSNSKGDVSEEENAKSLTEQEDYSDVQNENAGDNESEVEVEYLRLVRSGWSCTKGKKYTNVFYAAEIENPNKDYAVAFSRIIVTIKDEEGKILKNEEQVLNCIAAGDNIIYGNSIPYEGKEPSNVEISVSNGDDYYIQDDSIYLKSSEFTFSNISENNGTYKTFTGEITNNSNVNVSMAAISVIYKSGDDIIGGEVAYVDDLKAGETRAFEISASSDIEGYDSYEFYAIQW